MSISLKRLSTPKPEAEQASAEPFAYKKAAFVPLTHIPLGDVQLNLGYETLGGEIERKILKSGGKPVIKDGKAVTVTPLRFKLTKRGASGSASLLCGKYPLAFRFAQTIMLDPEAFEAQGNAALDAMAKMGLTPHFDGIEE